MPQCGAEKIRPRLRSAIKKLQTEAQCAQVCATIHMLQLLDLAIEFKMVEMLTEAIDNYLHEEIEEELFNWPREIILK